MICTASPKGPPPVAMSSFKHNPQGQTRRFRRPVARMFAAVLLMAPELLFPACLARPAGVEHLTQEVVEASLNGLPRSEADRTDGSNSRWQPSRYCRSSGPGDARWVCQRACTEAGLSGGQHALRNGSGGPLRI